RFTVQAAEADDGGGPSSRTVTVTVTEAPMLFTSGATASVTEGDLGTAPIYTAAATDPGGEQVTYSLTDDAGGAFRIDGRTGAVTVADASKTLAAATLRFTVRAAEADDGGGPSSRTVTVTVLDAPMLFSSGATASVAEGDLGTAALYVAAASDPAGESPLKY